MGTGAHRAGRPGPGRSRPIYCADLVTGSLGRRRNREIIGSPIAPPAWATGLLQRARAALLAVHRRSVPPSLHLLESLLAIFDNRVLGLLVELEVPDHLNGPRSLAELAEVTGTDPERLERVLRYAVGRGMLAQDRLGRYRASRLTAILRRDHPHSWRAWVETAGSDWFWSATRQLDGATRDRSTSGLEAATGHEFFEFVHEVKPDAGRAFDEAMQAGAAVQALALAHDVDWSGVGSVCDVGGGNGAALAILLDAMPDLRACLCDLPAVVDRPGGPLDGNAYRDRCEKVGGDFFVSVPSGHDRYLLLAVVHDWSDEEAVQILANVAAALPIGGRAFVVECVLSERPREEFAASSDLLMLILASGRERTVSQLELLFNRAGLRLVRAQRLATGFCAFELSAILPRDELLVEHP